MTTPRMPRDDVAAAMAARRELGPDYDEAFVDTVVARLQEAMNTPVAPHRQPAAARQPKDDHPVAITVLSLLAAIPLTAIAVVNAGLPGLLIAWIGLVLINLANAVRRR